jgi:hypothetical protein
MEKTMIVAVVGQNGPEAGGKFGFMGEAPLLRLETESGHLIEGKHGHRVWACKAATTDFAWYPIEELQQTDFVQYRLGDNLWGTNEVANNVVQAYVKDAASLEEVPRVIRTAAEPHVVAFLSAVFGHGAVQSREFKTTQTAIDIHLMLCNLGYTAVRIEKTVKRGVLDTTPRQMFSRVKASTVLGGAHPTYDINVPGSSTIVTNGIVSHNSDVRLKHTSRALSAAPFSPKPDKNKDYNESEASVEFDGKDVYRYVVIKAIKNKLWTPQRQAPLRIWVEDGSGTARGFDPVFDTIWYLVNTGQMAGTRKSFKLNLHKKGAGAKPITWEHLKRWVLGDKATMTKICQALGYKPFSIRTFCFSQMASGISEELYLEHLNSKNKNGSEEEEGSGGGDDE